MMFRITVLLLLSLLAVHAIYLTHLLRNESCVTVEGGKGSNGGGDGGSGIFCGPFLHGNAGGGGGGALGGDPTITKPRFRL